MPTAASHPPVPDCGPASAAKPRALVVQDPNHQRRVTALAVLQDLGFCVREAGRGVEAVSLVRHWEPQLILLDIQLRDASGREVESWLRAQASLREVPIVLLGGGSAVESGHTIALAAPFSSQSLARSITRAMGRLADRSEES